jgi:hypothetical protein
MGLMAHLERESGRQAWTFGGGTVMMLRINHRLSKDIDLFVPDPQYLGYCSPRLGGPAEDITSEYDEGAIFVKLYLPQGEIDVVVGTPLTNNSFEVVEHEGRTLQVETNAEIVAKKLFHRGYTAKARDLFDLCAVAHLEPEAIPPAAPFMIRHGATFLKQLAADADELRKVFGMIETIDFNDTFDQCVERANEVIGDALEMQRAAEAAGVATMGDHIGVITEIDGDVAVQRVNRNGEVARHSLFALSSPVQVGQLAEIRYHDKRGHVIVKEQGRDAGRGR